MELITESFDFTGAVKLISNVNNEYIIYEQIIHDQEFYPIKDGVYRFSFRQGAYQVITKKRISYNDFIDEFNEYISKGYQNLYYENTIVTSRYIIRIINNEKDIKVKYQFFYN